MPTTSAHPDAGLTELTSATGVTVGRTSVLQVTLNTFGSSIIGRWGKARGYYHAQADEHGWQHNLRQESLVIATHVVEALEHHNLLALPAQQIVVNQPARVASIFVDYGVVRQGKWALVQA
eukprot:TRINITY_DN11944_c0_g2_i1.p2 TRINITY_DN11944_c0_g2~~TRINITY_DN11944_c0_g2_i1.p2  ORF type:complete len:121 (-),score=9.34 TRINITY_DN11944_c0_g2_i1:214-576(-)